MVKLRSGRDVECTPVKHVKKHTSNQQTNDLKSTGRPSLWENLDFEIYEDVPGAARPDLDACAFDARDMIENNQENVVPSAQASGSMGERTAVSTGEVDDYDSQLNSPRSREPLSHDPKFRLSTLSRAVLNQIPDFEDGDQNVRRGPATTCEPVKGGASVPNTADGGLFKAQSQQCKVPQAPKLARSGVKLLDVTKLR